MPVRLPLLSCFFIFSSLFSQERVRVGAEILLEKHLDLLLARRVGIVCNHTSILPNGRHLVDTLVRLKVNVTALFSPEHGIRGTVPDGVKVPDTIDPKTGIRVFSLYGARQKPTPTMLDSLDVILVDLQDVGARFYTYYITMSYVMEAAAENEKGVIVLDRPNPINGVDIEGPVLDTSRQSSVGRFRLPIRHGLTLGELARMIVGENWLGSQSKIDLTVITLEGWKREQWYDDTGLRWIPPSPNMKFLSTAIVYPGTCLFEATNVSEGRGAFKPFEYIGAPWIDGKQIAAVMNALSLPGVRFHAIIFTPAADSIRAPNPKYDGHQCGGVFIQVIDRSAFRPVLTGLSLLATLDSLYRKRLEINGLHLDRLTGSREIKKALDQRMDPQGLVSQWISELEGFRQLRRKYLLY